MFPNIIVIPDSNNLNLQFILYILSSLLYREGKKSQSHVWKGHLLPQTFPVSLFFQCVPFQQGTTWILYDFYFQVYIGFAPIFTYHSAIFLTPSFG